MYAGQLDGVRLAGADLLADAEPARRREIERKEPQAFAALASRVSRGAPYRRHIASAGLRAALALLTSPAHRGGEDFPDVGDLFIDTEGLSRRTVLRVDPQEEAILQDFVGDTGAGRLHAALHLPGASNPVSVPSPSSPFTCSRGTRATVTA